VKHITDPVAALSTGSEVGGDSNANNLLKKPEI
jgi:hypothetical protein